ncbi:MAG TPA: LuxR C-terminal-related transcriptional regulator [Allosphingosinicella sp.]|jgi:FixJ family two-component response regulator
MSHQRKVYVVGPNLEVRRLLSRHISAAGAEAWPFASGADFLGILEHLAPACILLDMDDGDVPGIEVLTEIVAREIAWPVIAISGREEFQLAIEAMKLGAIDFLRLPLSREILALALAPAWEALERVVAAADARRAAQERLARLTAREMDVLMALLGGRSNKAIAHDFGISVRTVEMHRAHTMAKLEVKSLAEAALLAPRAGLDVSAATALVPKPRSTALTAYAGSSARDQLATLARRLSS